MVKTIHAIYKRGVLKPLEPIEGIGENTKVEVTISTEKDVSLPFLKFAGILSEEEANKMMKVVDDEFERINQDEWRD